MSAIYGLVDLSGNAVNNEINDRIHKGYSHCLIDRYKHLVHDNAAFGTEIQILNVEDEVSKWDTPLYDEVKDIVVVAEGTLDNRSSILQQLGEADCVSDSWLIYKSYVKWGRKCVTHLRGVFSFVIYDKKANSVFLYVDHFANNCLYYFVRDNRLFFSTMLFPMVDASGYKFETNDRWLLESISIVGPVMMSEPRECAYKNIYKVPAGHCVEISLNKRKEHCYWNPAKTVSPDPKITDSECRTQLRKYLFDSVEACTRTNGEVAVALSSGLDSTTVGGIAAGFLEKNGKKLYSFTSVPLKESRVENAGGVIRDETQGVLEMCKKYPNIEPHFEQCRDMNILTEAQRVINEWELPCKSQQNGVWTGELYKQARKKGCKIMLSGTTGNTTISAGHNEDYVMELFTHMHFKKAFKVIQLVLVRYGTGGRKKYFKWLRNKYREYYKNNVFPDKNKFYKDVLIRSDKGEKYGLCARYYKKVKEYKPINTIGMMRNLIYIYKACAQIGEVDTKNWLVYGVLDRDPLRNVEFVEFLYTLPMRCFVNENFDRRLIREFMDDIVPDALRLNIKSRGLQGSDNMYRLSKNWNDKYDEIRTRLFSKQALDYLDVNKIHELIDSVDSENLEKNEPGVVRIINAYIFVLFLEKINKYV